MVKGMVMTLPLSQKVLAESTTAFAELLLKTSLLINRWNSIPRQIALHSFHKDPFLTLVRDSYWPSTHRYLHSHDHISFLVNSQESIGGFYLCLGLLQATSRQLEQSKSYTWQLQSFKAFMNVALFGSLEASTAQNAKGCI